MLLLSPMTGRIVAATPPPTGCHDCVSFPVKNYPCEIYAFHQECHKCFLCVKNYPPPRENLSHPEIYASGSDRHHRCVNVLPYVQKHSQHVYNKSTTPQHATILQQVAQQSRISGFGHKESRYIKKSLTSPSARGGATVLKVGDNFASGASKKNFF